MGPLIRWDPPSDKDLLVNVYLYWKVIVPVSRDPSLLQLLSWFFRDVFCLSRQCLKYLDLQGRIPFIRTICFPKVYTIYSHISFVTVQGELPS